MVTNGHLMAFLGRLASLFLMAILAGCSTGRAKDQFGIRIDRINDVQVQRDAISMRVEVTTFGRFNKPLRIASLSFYTTNGEFMEEVNKRMGNIKTETLQNVKEMVLHTDSIFGFIEPIYKQHKAKLKKVSQKPGVKKLIKQRETARQEKDFKKADHIRAQLSDLGVEVKDTIDGTDVQLIQKVS